MRRVVAFVLVALVAALSAGCDAATLLGVTSHKASFVYRIGEPCSLAVRLVFRDGTVAYVWRNYTSCPDTTGVGALGYHYIITAPR